MNESDRKLIRMMGVLSTVGLTIVFATVIGLFIGLKLDDWFGTTPWLSGLFLLLGILAGFRNLFKYAKQSQKDLDEQRKDDQ